MCLLHDLLDTLSKTFTLEYLVLIQVIQFSHLIHVEITVIREMKHETRGLKPVTSELEILTWGQETVPRGLKPVTRGLEPVT